MSDGHSDGFLLEEVHHRVCVCRDQLGRAIHVGDWIWYSGWGMDIIRAQVVGFGFNCERLVGNALVCGRERHYIHLSDRNELYLEDPLGSSTQMVVLC